MDLTKLTVVVTFILALSIASERLVEIIKGFFPSLEKEDPDPRAEARRRSYLQILAVGAGILTAYLARDYIPIEMEVADMTKKGSAIIGLGLLASGGSGFWNAILTYFGKVKELKKFVAQEKKRALNNP